MLKAFFGYWRTVCQYLATEKGNHDFWDHLRALVLIVLSMAAAVALVHFVFG
ncbi:hypothetical protein QCO44_02405 [Selenomonas sputigena]|uniref:DUF2970 domain-containing protein n=1 Tax=Selenomonas sputigena TaxID=69823 RepID=A0ABV3X311_9FIRM